MLNEGTQTAETNSQVGSGVVDTPAPDKSLYDFPVKLAKLRTVDGVDVPHTRAVIRTDRNEVISTVSDRYKIIGHDTIMNSVMPYMQELGEPELKFYAERRGARFTAEYVFKNHQIEVGHNHVALRVIVQNAYQTGFAARVQVLVVVLECLNLGIITEKSLFDVAVRHSGEKTDLKLPTPETLLKAFTGSQAVFERYHSQQLSLNQGGEFLDDGRVCTALPEGTRQGIDKLWAKGYDEGKRSVWDLLQHATYEITHKSPRLSFTGRHQRLTHVARIFNAVFSGY